MKNNDFYPVREVKTLKDLVKSNGEVYGDAPAFLEKKEKGGPYFNISHKQFMLDVDALGTKLLELGLKGENIAVMGTNSYQWEVAYFAIVNGVGTCVPLDKELKKEEIYNLIEASSCSAVFYSEEHNDLFQNYDKVKYKFGISLYSKEEDKENPNHIKSLVSHGYDLIALGKTKYNEIEIKESDTCAILFTSGTTGVPKGVVLTHGNIAAVVMATGKVEDFTGKRSLSILPIHHTFESAVIMVLLHQGGSVAFFEGLKYVVKNLQEAKANMVVGVPLIVESIYNKIWAEAKKQKKDGALKAAVKIHKTLKTMGIDRSRQLFKSVYKNFGGELDMFLCGAAALNPATARGLMDLGFTVLQGYGLTECAPLITATPMKDDIYLHAGSCGKVVPEGELRISNPDKEGIGEIVFKGPNVMTGYYNLPEETAEVIKDEWFYTGDLGFLDPKGWLYITGRQKNIIVTKTGKNIYPEEIELLVNKMAFVADSMVYGLDIEGDDKADTEVAVQILPDFEKIYEERGEDFPREKIAEMFKEEIKSLNDTMAIYKRIKEVKVRDIDFQRTTTKKIKRQENI